MKRKKGAGIGLAAVAVGVILLLGIRRGRKGICTP